MKNQFLFLACALISAGAQAYPEQVPVKISMGDSSTTVTTLMGQPAPVQIMDGPVEAKCVFKGEFGSTYELSVGRSANGLTASVLPVESDAYGVKVFVDIIKTTGPDPTLATITKDCQLPVGVTSTMHIGTLDTFKWNKPTKLMFADGSFVTVTVEK